MMIFMLLRIIYPSLGIHNAQLYLFETPVMTYEFRPFIMPKTMELIINVENGQRQPIKIHMCY